MSRNPSLEFAWPAVTPRAAAAAWSRELSARLEQYLAAAREHLAAGRLAEAVAAWQGALRDVPGMPVPRRDAIARLITDTAFACARRALQQPEPDTAAALAWLERVLAWDGLLDEAGRREALQAYALLVHWSGRPDDALPYYRAASAGDRDASSGLEGRRGLDAWHELDAACAYGATLARLQVAAGGGSAGAADGAAGVAPEAPRPADDHHLAGAAWRRLRAMDMLLGGDAAGALAAFPGADTPALPRAWALEGALLAAACSRWSTSLQYYRRALGAEGFSGLPPGGLHRFVFLAAVLEGSGEPEAADLDAWVTALRLPARPPRALFPDAAAYRAWAAAVRRRQLRLWAQRALWELKERQDEPDGGAGAVGERLRRSLYAVVRWHSRSAAARWLRVWLPCAGPRAGAGVRRRRRLRDSAAPDGAPLHLLQLSVLAAERFGGPEDVVARLNRLLRKFPRNAWGLARWRTWMLRLADEAVRDGRFRQALFQYVSLVLYAPDDAEGWLGCAAMWGMLGEDARAADCRREARRALKASRLGAGGPGPAPGDGAVLRGILEALLEEALGEDGPVPELPVAKAMLVRAVAASLRRPDVYLRFLLERWAGGPMSLASAG